MPELDIPYWLERCSVEDTGSVLDLQGPHPWRWIKWIFVAVYILLLDPSLVDRSLAWMWIGFTGLVAVTIGSVEILAPSWVRDFRGR